MNQLIANVSSVPKVRQLTAFRTDLVCVSTPRNKATRFVSLAQSMANLTRRRPARGALRHAHNVKIARSTMDMARDCVHFAEGNQTNSLIRLNNNDASCSRRCVVARPLQTRITMRAFFIFMALCVLCETATAQTPECKSIPNPAARLACYDRTAPAVATSAASQPVMRASPAAKVDGTGYVDSISREDAIMNERIRGICRGC
ncbi:hypothetical protein [Bradyrhizobium canariense]|uniref:hypothetical protein n=1 Tax=Bradyrhizobium canariense TaxID=255045 RepID=UPI0014313FE4|nr:hypothetical protein [Bradyrhizobium canariense]